MSIRTCTANILPHLHEEDRPRALYQGLLHDARECAGQAPRFSVDPLPTGETPSRCNLRAAAILAWSRTFGRPICFLQFFQGLLESVIERWRWSSFAVRLGGPPDD